MREINYMRISVTDRCNLRCNYCIPKEGVPLFSQDEMLTFDEIVRLAKIFASLGGKKIRLTGGEPLIKKGIVDLVHRISEIKGIEKVCLTTNGTLLAGLALDLKRAGLNQINVSLDTLDRKKFEQITGSDEFNSVMEGISCIKKVGFNVIKLNTLIMRGINDGEILDFIEFAMRENLTLRFLEFMKVTPLWDKKYYLSVREIKSICEKKYKLHKIDESVSGPAEYYGIGNSRIGFIRTDRENCSQCDRVRVTSVGKLKVCLYEKEGEDLRELLRDGSTDEEISNIIKSKMGIKDDVHYKKWNGSNILMSSVGG